MFVLKMLAVKTMQAARVRRMDWLRLLSTIVILVLAACSARAGGGSKPAASVADSAQTVMTRTSAAPTLTPVPMSGIDLNSATPVPTRASATIVRDDSPATSSPVATPAPSSTPTDVARPRVVSFNVAPTTALTLGQKIVVKWEAVGSRAEMCPIGDLGPIRCEEVPLTGDMTIETNDLGERATSLGLRVILGQSFVWSSAALQWQCFHAWFFDNPPSACPDAAPIHSQAAAQGFEHGFIIWVEASDTFYVFHAEERQTFEQLPGPLRLKPGASVDNRAGETPPPQAFEPVSGFGLLWRGEVDGLEGVRQRLGWATAPEMSFNTTYQCATAGRGAWTCYLLGPSGSVLFLRPDSTAQAHFLWEER